MEPLENSLTRCSPLHNPPPQLNINPHPNNNNNNNNYYHIHSSSNCPVHNRLIKPHTHHHPFCPHSLSTPLMTQGVDDQAIIEEEGEEEPVLVLTDEWSDFFAKSDAKRKAVKKQAKKKAKTTVES